MPRPVGGDQAAVPGVRRLRRAALGGEFDVDGGAPGQVGRVATEGLLEGGVEPVARVLFSSRFFSEPQPS